MINSVAQDFKIVDNDLYINPSTGDFEFAPSDNQHIEDLLDSPQGSYKEFPLATIYLSSFLKTKSNQALESQMKQILEADGYLTKRPSITVDKSGRATVSPNAVRKPF